LRSTLSSAECKRSDHHVECQPSNLHTCMQEDEMLAHTTGSGHILPLSQSNVNLWAWWTLAYSLSVYMITQRPCSWSTAALLY
jgi:hypothetical protein